MKKLVDFMMEDEKLKECVVTYEGGGDSGDVYSIELIDNKGKVINEDIKITEDVEELIKQISMEYLEYKHPGWEIDEGSDGEIRYKKSDNGELEIELEHRDNCSKYDTEEIKVDLNDSLKKEVKIVSNLLYNKFNNNFVITVVSGKDNNTYELAEAKALSKEEQKILNENCKQIINKYEDYLNEIKKDYELLKSIVDDLDRKTYELNFFNEEEIDFNIVMTLIPEDNNEHTVIYNSVDKEIEVEEREDKVEIYTCKNKIIRQINYK